MNKKIFNFENYGETKSPVPSGEVYVVDPQGEYAYENYNLDQYIGDRNVILIGIPGAFTPTCSSQQLPGFENNYLKLKDLGIDEVYCCSVNDSYTMNAWADKLKIYNIKLIPDGSGLFTKFMGMLVSKDHNGFGQRSWRYMAIINNGIIEKWWQEPGINNDGSDDDPYIETTPENCIKYLLEKNKIKSIIIK